jgi:hypothetical protein
MNERLLATIIAFLTLTLTTTAYSAIDANKILQAAELIRNPQEDYEVNVVLDDLKNNKKESHTYQTLVKGREKSLVRFLTPVEDKGTKVLMVEDQMWVFVPSAAKPIRIAPRQRLTGNAAYGDIVRLSFVDNYTATWLRNDTDNKKKVVILQLDAIPGRPVTYDKIEYWVEANTNRPIKAFYQTSSGKTLREGYFEKFEDLFGLNRPTRFVLVDHLQKDHVTTIDFVNPKKTNLPNLLFEKQNFGRN